MRFFLTPFLALFFVINLTAQKPNKEKIKTLKIAHITNKLDLTAKEAQAFWPIYNANEDVREMLKEKAIGRKKENEISTLTETEAKALVLEILKIEKEKQRIQDSYVKELLTILPAKKVINLIQTERSFKRKMLEEFKQRHKRRQNK